MARNIYHFKGNFKSFLFVLAILLVIGFLYYTQLLVSDLQEQSRDFLKFRIKIFEENINAEDSQDLSFFFNEVIQTADYPSIYTDAEGEPAFWRNIDIPQQNTRPLPEEIELELKEKIREFDQMNEPIPISYQGSVLGFYHYGQSQIIQQLKWLPYIEVAVVALFILIGYAGFSSIKKSEERLIWVGMAKETAHQLGTPLSSLIGWFEYMKSSPNKTAEVLPDIGKDLDRLQTVANRFSKIGSVPDLKKEEIDSIISEVLDYFSRRLPQGEGKVQISKHVQPELPPLMLNRDLFSWVMENLIKNALDALEGNGGYINIFADYLGEKQIYVDIQDSGRGIQSRERKNIFKPGFSTKKRGWGLGLSLAKRIIEDYHGGNIELKETQAGMGSTFRIILKINNA
ncbi:MAG: sensor histidine kinase [Calditrichaeota bacterium]|nr:sensor histidine kinase [Calditrichota bacterium]RQV92497.1 MAG: sensor histidine kinase [bacterium]RQV99353.1 MAG: sensor histidine kinase [Calditrichota bacterium]